MKTCIHCLVVKPDTDFYTNGSSKSRSECKLCTRLRQKATSYGITVTQLELQYKLQNKKCAICQKSMQLLDMVVDHNHNCCNFGGRQRKCGSCIRGLLCNSCNSGIGFMQDSVRLLDSATKYLLKFQNVLD